MLKIKNCNWISENSYRLIVYHGYDAKGKQNRKMKTYKLSKDIKNIKYQPIKSLVY